MGTSWKYALATGATLVTLWLSPSHSEAKIIYTRVGEVIGGSGQLPLDLNNDGTNEFTVVASANQIGCGVPPLICGLQGSVKVNASQGGDGVVASGSWAAVLDRGDRIDSSLSFYEGQSLMTNFQVGQHPGNYDYGYWLNKRGYLGLEFRKNGGTHYGWAQMQVEAAFHYLLYTSLTSYAYETIVGKSIVAGQTRGRDDMTQRFGRRAFVGPRP